MTKKRFTFILSSLLLSGGVQVVVEYANRLSKRGHEVVLVSPGNARSEEITALLDKEVQLQEVMELVNPSLMHYKIRLAWTLAKAVPDSNYIISTHTPTTIVTLIAKLCLRKKGLPIWFYMDYPGMFSNRKIEQILMRFALLWHKKALTLSSFSKDELYGITSSHKPVHVIGLGISNRDCFNLLPPVKIIKTRNDTRAILYLGDHRRRKGLYDFISAMEIVKSKFPDIELWFALKDEGSIPTTLSYERFDRPTVMLLADLYKSCDLFVSASWYEGFGLPPLEAMACGAPVVLTDSGGVREYAIHNHNCIITPPKDHTALSQAIITVLSDSELEQKLRKNGPLTAAHFTWERSVNALEQALSD
jgi:glycosyltransferase involved in cell wall biosynthesis